MGYKVAKMIKPYRRLPIPIRDLHAGVPWVPEGLPPITTLGGRRGSLGANAEGSEGDSGNVKGKIQQLLEKNDIIFFTAAGSENVRSGSWGFCNRHRKKDEKWTF